MILLNGSHPVWVRGLKQEILTTQRRQEPVAPRVGAWIETEERTKLNIIIAVAPRVGAWIETFLSLYFVFRSSSHPVWVRGLKRQTT